MLTSHLVLVLGSSQEFLSANNIGHQSLIIPTFPGLFWEKSDSWEMAVGNPEPLLLTPNEVPKQR